MWARTCSATARIRCEPGSWSHRWTDLPSRRRCRYSRPLNRPGQTAFPLRRNAPPGRTSKAAPDPADTSGAVPSDHQPMTMGARINHPRAAVDRPLHHDVTAGHPAALVDVGWEFRGPGAKAAERHAPLRVVRARRPRGIPYDRPAVDLTARRPAAPRPPRPAPASGPTGCGWWPPRWPCCPAWTTARPCAWICTRCPAASSTWPGTSCCASSATTSAATCTRAWWAPPSSTPSGPR